MKKQVISVVTTLCLVISLLSGLGTSAASVSGKTNEYTYIRMSPYWTAEVIDTIASNINVTVIERDMGYLYIEYNHNGVKRGYAPLQSVTIPSYSWCNHTIFAHGHNKSGASVTVRYGPASTYASSGSIDSDEGTNATKPLLVLGESNGYYFVQYVTNPTATGSTQPLYKRGWVPTSSVQVDNPTLPPLTDTTSSYQYAFISNSSNQYLTVVADSSEASGYKLTFMSATGDNIQQWKFVKVNYTGKTYYKIYSAYYNLCLHIDGSSPIVGSKMILTAPSHPNKAQEFSFSSVISTAVEGKTVRILPRSGGTFLALQKSGTGLYMYRAGESTEQYLRIDPIDNHWQNGYEITDGAELIYNTFGSAIVGNITHNIIDTAANEWNGISNNVSLSKSSDNYYNITINGSNLGTSSGRTTPIIDYTGEEDTSGAHLNDNWYGTNIYINTVSGSVGYMANKTSDDLQKLITHELGHALKLRHPHEAYDSEGEYHTYHVISSVMNQGLFSQYTYVSKTPSGFDKRSLCEKWK